MKFKPLPEPRGIAVVYPHTSNWDFVIGVLGKWALNLPFRWLAKDSLFKIPLVGRWFYYMGGAPVNRSAPQGLIQSQAEAMHKEDWYWVGITPEGTRAYKPYWKSGFYQLAMAAKVPLVLVYIDFPNKTLGMTEHIWLTGDEETDMAAIRAGFDGHLGKHPELMAPIVLRQR
ncbi:1-acyl-sn-glycerol-3-phosphate acyltransferase [Pseudoduganella violaceinigra]|uniref:1-acyl-sn-glycerol-3-phosphate acyltransferase n=1 Tax=Pseudoduganella violaceinigra TaxID=246602 RepID=UPI0027D9029F|nr:1-acyl-sn-glycerol-3-phosphate acyltransferase [Pseudoduganella violaceinigra]